MARERSSCGTRTTVVGTCTSWASPTQTVKPDCLFLRRRTPPPLGSASLDSRRHPPDHEDLHEPDPAGPDPAARRPAYLPMLVGAALMSSDSGPVAGIGLLVYLVGVAAVIGVAIWNLLIRQGRTGWSIGKQVVGIRLIGEKT